jgi:hypothetical protein
MENIEKEKRPIDHVPYTTTLRMQREKRCAQIIVRAMRKFISEKRARRFEKTSGKKGVKLNNFNDIILMLNSFNVKENI